MCKTRIKTSAYLVRHYHELKTIAVAYPSLALHSLPPPALGCRMYWQCQGQVDFKWLWPPGHLAAITQAGKGGRRGTRPLASLTQPPGWRYTALPHPAPSLALHWPSLTQPPAWLYTGPPHPAPRLAPHRSSHTHCCAALNGHTSSAHSHHIYTT